MVEEMFAFEWDDHPDIGYYVLYIKDLRNNWLVSLISSVSIWDYTVDVQRQIRKGRRERNIAFEWSYCRGFSYEKAHSFDEGLTLSDVKRECELYLCSLAVKEYENALKTADKIKDLALWSKDHMLNAHVKEIE